MRLINVSIGKVQTVQVGNDVMKTAHIKSPAPRPWVITENGALGDERASHPDKIYAFARSAYGYWGEYLGIDPAKWPDGFFGENLTLEELDEDDLRVGDVFALGEQVRLVVAGARNPCVKLAWRLSQPRSFQKIFALSRRSGAYFGVLQTGEVEEGDTLVRIHRETGLPSITELCQWINSHDPLPLEPLKRLLAFDRMSPTNRLLLGPKLNAAERAASQIEGRWEGWRSFSIERVVDEAPEIRSFYLRAEDGERLCQPKPGQFVSVRMDGRDDGPIIRSWSLSDFSHDIDEYRLTVRRQAGPGSNWLHAATAGTRVELRAPTGEFHLDMGGFRPVALVAAGIGITPLYAMLRAHLTRPDPAPIYLIYGARTPEEIALKPAIDQIAADHAQVHVFYIYSRCDAGCRPATRVTPKLVTELLSGLYITLHDRRIDLPWYENDMYICGPGDFCASLKDGLVALGANPDHTFVELFDAPDLVDTDLDEAEVSFARSGKSAVWRADEDLTLLELAERAGIEVEYSCRAGSCMTCITRLVDGETTADTGDGQSLLCIAKPKSPRVSFDL